LSKKKEPDKKVTVPKPELALQPEPQYSRSELIEAASSFGVKPEVMAGALKLAGKDTMTKAEAEKAIKDFLKRRV
jgi:hypothetical protein